MTSKKITFSPNVETVLQKRMLTYDQQPKFVQKIIDYWHGKSNSKTQNLILKARGEKVMENIAAETVQSSVTEDNKEDVQAYTTEDISNPIEIEEETLVQEEMIRPQDKTKRVYTAEELKELLLNFPSEVDIESVRQYYELRAAYSLATGKTVEYLVPGQIDRWERGRRGLIELDHLEFTSVFDEEYTVEDCIKAAFRIIGKTEEEIKEILEIEEDNTMSFETEDIFEYITDESQKIPKTSSVLDLTTAASSADTLSASTSNDTIVIENSSEVPSVPDIMTAASNADTLSASTSNDTIEVAPESVEETPMVSESVKAEEEPKKKTSHRKKTDAETPKRTRRRLTEEEKAAREEAKKKAKILRTEMNKDIKDAIYGEVKIGRKFVQYEAVNSLHGRKIRVSLSDAENAYGFSPDDEWLKVNMNFRYENHNQFIDGNDLAIIMMYSGIEDPYAKVSSIMKKIQLDPPNVEPIEDVSLITFIDHERDIENPDRIVATVHWLANRLKLVQKEAKEKGVKVRNSGYTNTYLLQTLVTPVQMFGAAVILNSEYKLILSLTSERIQKYEDAIKEATKA